MPSAVDPDLPGPRDGVHPDPETGPPAAHPAGPAGPEGRGAAWRTEPEPETGEPQVGSNGFRLQLHHPS